jgi:hypothetical protein
MKITTTGSSKKNAWIIKTYHSKTAKYIEIIQVQIRRNNEGFGFAELMMCSQRR